MKQQFTIKEHKGLYYVFKTMTRSWSNDNDVYIKDAKYIADTMECALEWAYENRSQVDLILTHLNDGREVHVREAI